MTIDITEEPATDGNNSEPRKGPYRRPAPPAIIPDYIVRVPPPTTPITLAPRQTLSLASNIFERSIVLAARNQGVLVTYGRDRVALPLLDAISYNGELYVSGLWGRGEIEAIESWTVNNKTADTGVLAVHYTGSATQTVDPWMVTVYGANSITHTDPLIGLAYAHFKFPIGTNIGDIHGIVKGVKVYDPRDGTQTLGTGSTYK